MRQQQDIDKIIAAIELQKELWPKFQKWNESKKWYQKIFIILGVIFGEFKKVKAFVKSLPEIGREFIDMDPAEAEQIYIIIAEQLQKPTEEVKEDIKNIVIGSGYFNIGIQGLIEHTK